MQVWYYPCFSTFWNLNLFFYYLGEGGKRKGEGVGLVLLLLFKALKWFLIVVKYVSFSNFLRMVKCKFISLIYTMTLYGGHQSRLTLSKQSPNLWIKAQSKRLKRIKSQRAISSVLISHPIKKFPNIKLS